MQVVVAYLISFMLYLVGPLASMVLYMTLARCEFFAKSGGVIWISLVLGNIVLGLLSGVTFRRFVKSRTLRHSIYCCAGILGYTLITVIVTSLIRPSEWNSYMASDSFVMPIAALFVFSASLLSVSALSRLKA